MRLKLNRIINGYYECYIYCASKRKSQNELINLVIKSRCYTFNHKFITLLLHQWNGMQICNYYNYYKKKSREKNFPFNKVEINWIVITWGFEGNRTALSDLWIDIFIRWNWSMNCNFKLRYNFQSNEISPVKKDRGKFQTIKVKKR